MVRDPSYFLSSLPQTYFMHRDGSLLRVMVDTPDNLRHLRTELELLKRVARKSVSWRGVVDSAVAEKYQESDRTELDRILFDAWHPMIEEMIALFDQEFDDVKEEILLSVVDEEAANIVQEAAECGILKPVDELVGKNKMKNPYGSSMPSDIEDALAAAEKAIANAAQMNAQEQDQENQEDEVDQDQQIPKSFDIDLEQATPPLDSATDEAEMEMNPSEDQDKPDPPLQFMEESEEPQEHSEEDHDDNDEDEGFDVSSNVPENVSLPEMDDQPQTDECSEDGTSTRDCSENVQTATPDYQDTAPSVSETHTFNPFVVDSQSDGLDSMELDSTPVSQEEKESFISEVLDHAGKDSPVQSFPADISTRQNSAEESPPSSFELPEPEAMITAALEETQPEAGTIFEHSDDETEDETPELNSLEGTHQDNIDQIPFEIPDPQAAIETLQEQMDQVMNEEPFDPFAQAPAQMQESMKTPPDTNHPPDTNMPMDITDEITDPPDEEAGFSLSDPVTLKASTAPQPLEEKQSYIPTAEELESMNNNDSAFDDFDESQLDATPVDILDVDSIIASAEDRNVDDMSNESSIPDSQNTIITSDAIPTEEKKTFIPTAEELESMNNNDSAFDDFDESQLDATPVDMLDVDAIMASAEDQDVDDNSKESSIQDSQNAIITSDTISNEEKKAFIPTQEELANLQDNDSAFDDFDESQLDATPVDMLDVDAIMASADEQSNQDMMDTASNPALESNSQPIEQNNAGMLEESKPSDQTQQESQMETDVKPLPESPNQEQSLLENPFAANVPVNMDPGQSTPPDATVLPEPVLSQVVLPVALQPETKAENMRTDQSDNISEPAPHIEPQPPEQQEETDKPMENVPESTPIEYTPERAQQAVLEIEKGIRKLSDILNTEVNEQWKVAQQSLQQIVESHVQINQTKQNVEAVMAELAQLKSEMHTLRDETKQAREQAMQFREEARQFKERADASAQMAEIAADQATKEVENARKAAAMINLPQTS